MAQRQQRQGQRRPRALLQQGPAPGPAATTNHPAPQVTLVVNYDVPVERDQRTPAFETYLHRIGRSGRFGRKGAAFNFITGAEVRAAGLQPACSRSPHAPRAAHPAPPPAPAPRPPPPPAPPQEQRQVDTIAGYFNRFIPEVPYNDEDAFLEVLKQAGLADQ